MEYTKIEEDGLKDVMLSMFKVSLEQGIPVQKVAQMASDAVDEFVQSNTNYVETKDEPKEEKPPMVAVTEIGDAIKSILREKKMSEKEFGKRMHMSYAKCQKLFKGATPVTMELAQQLEEVLGKPAEEWMDMQIHVTPFLREEESKDISLPKLFI